MAGLQINKQGKYDQKRTFPNGQAEIASFGDGLSVGRFTMRPGWKWSDDVRPIVGTKSCEVEHFGYCLSGRMRVAMNDGEEAEFSAGDVMRIRPGHDAWVVGNEPCVMLDFTGATHYATRGLDDLARWENGIGAPAAPEARH